MEVNIWKRFSDMFPKGARTIGLVFSHNTVQGTSVIQLRDGTTFSAKGTSVAVGQNAIVIDGNVVSSAPALTQYDVVV